MIFASDLRMLSNDTDEPIVFFGGKDYLPLFCDLTKNVKAKRTVFYNSGYAPAAQGCALVRFVTTTRTNWHYECANFNGDLPKRAATVRLADKAPKTRSSKASRGTPSEQKVETHWPRKLKLCGKPQFNSLIFVGTP